uniref:Apelin n=1 Tax=Naja naja TaxID=35670 RepID=A0A8C6XWZ6_NAJNA
WTRRPPRSLPTLLFCRNAYMNEVGPVSEASDGKELLEGQAVNLAHPKVARSVGGHRHNAWRRYRRPRPRLSHKGPMPF